MDSDSSTKFIGSLTKFLQSLCNGYVEFEDGVELIGHIYLSVDHGKSAKKMNYFLNEKVCKNDNSVTFISNSFHAQPDQKKNADNKKDDGDISDSGDSVPRSTNTGTIPSRASLSARAAQSPNQNRTGPQIGSKRPGSPLKAPTPPQRRAPTPPSQRRMQSTAPKGPVGSPASKTVPSSPSSSSQDNIPSPLPVRKPRGETSQPPSNQSDNTGADIENDSLVGSNLMSINPPPDFASFLGSLTGDNQNTSRDHRSPQRDTKPDTDVTFIKEEFVSEPSSCAQAGSSGQHSGRSGDEHLDSSGLYPVMLHQNTSVFPSTSAGYPPGFPGASATATSQQPGFPSTSQSDLFNPVAGGSQDGADPSAVEMEGRHYGTGDGLDSSWPVYGALRLGHQTGPLPMSEHRAEAVRKKTVFCSYCDKKFWNKSDCLGHINSQHLKLKPFMCKICSLTFSYKQSLRSHEMFCRNCIDKTRTNTFTSAV